jgi:hypothetical protein
MGEVDGMGEIYSLACVLRFEQFHIEALKTTKDE